MPPPCAQDNYPGVRFPAVSRLQTSRIIWAQPSRRQPGWRIAQDCLSMTSATSAQAGSTWAPLQSPVFRALWIAQFVSNLGTWMQTVGAQWMLVGDPRAAVLVPLVQTATTLPVMLLALPSGVLADLIDRRRLLIATQGAMAAGVGLLAALTA